MASNTTKSEWVITKLSEISNFVVKNNSILEHKFVELKALLNKLEELSENETADVQKGIEKTIKDLKEFGQIGDAMEKALLEIEVKLLKVEKRGNKGRVRAERNDSGVYSTDSRVLSSSGGHVVQATDAVAPDAASVHIEQASEYDA